MQCTSISGRLSDHYTNESGFYHPDQHLANSQRGRGHRGVGLQIRAREVKQPASRVGAARSTRNGIGC
jgi:hypothetical protein